MIALRFWYVVIDSFIQGAPNGASCYFIPTVGWCISLFKVKKVTDNNGKAIGVLYASVAELESILVSIRRIK